MVYFIQEGAHGPIKIGYTQSVRSVYNRRDTLQTGNPRWLSILARAEGGPELERKLHALCSDWRLVGEWFEPVDVVRKLVELYQKKPEYGVGVFPVIERMTREPPSCAELQRRWARIAESEDDGKLPRRQAKEKAQYRFTGSQSPSTLLKGKRAERKIAAKIEFDRALEDGSLTITH